jgi:chromosome segregation ATPase
MALEQPEDVNEFSEYLLGLADALDERLNAALADEELDEEDVDALQSQGNKLREQADALMEEAVERTLDSLSTDQADLMAVIEEAKAKIERIERIEKIAPLLAALVLLVTGLAGGAPGVVAALQNVRKHSA